MNLLLKCTAILFDALVISNNKNKINLIVIRLDAIGDFILWLDTAKEYRRLYPNRKITLLANAAWVDLACGLPYWDEVWPVEVRKLTRNPLYRWRLLWEISRAGFAIAIQPTFSRVLMHGDSLVHATGAIERIGSEGDLSNITAKEKIIADHWYTRLLPASKQPLMELERNAEFISILSGQTYTAAAPQLPTLLTLPQHLRPKREYFIIFPGASWHGKQWSPVNFARTLTKIYEKWNWQPILCGALTEHALCEKVAALTSVPCLNLAGQTSLPVLVELLRKTRLLISNDTSAIHIAAAVNAPSVCILGGGHYGRFMPYTETIKGDHKPLVAIHEMPCFNCNWQCNQPHDPTGPVPCISEVTVEDVLKQVNLAIDK